MLEPVVGLSKKMIAAECDSVARNDKNDKNDENVGNGENGVRDDNDENDNDADSVAGLYRLQFSDDVPGFVISPVLRQSEAIQSGAFQQAVRITSTKPVKLTTSAEAATASNSKRLQAAADRDFTRRLAARVDRSYVSVTVAALESGLSRSIVSSWAEQKLVQNMKTGVGNTKRIVDLGDVLRFRDQKLAPSMSRSLDPNCRAVFYTRINGDEGDGTELERTDERFYARVLQQHPEATKWRAYRCSEIGRQADLNRPGFVQLMALIMARELDTLIVANVEQICLVDCLPLFLWILANNHVTLHVLTPPPEQEEEKGGGDEVEDKSV